MRNATSRIMTGAIALLKSQARTATINSDGVRGAHIIISVSASADTPSVVPKIQGKNQLTGAWYDILTGAAITGTGVTVLKVFPGAPVTTNVSTNDFLPEKWRVRMEHSDTDSITYSVAANTLEDAGV
jgi:hypothetical protein